ncbi:MAG: thiamine pyrophosphate-dependent enzyme, partial [Lachnospiraceae bacterium]|nr:thiamine pyrophosphate-dependent enzyme [Lachnospiraceae bacterium]
SYTGARTMVTMKQVGLNVASDPLMSLNYVGVLGGMVILVADDPGPISSQTEQDTRHFAKFAKLALFDPSTPEEAYIMIADAFAHSEKYGRPVLFRPTTRVCHSCSSIELLPALPKTQIRGFQKDGRRVIFPRLSYAEKIKIEKSLLDIREEFSEYDQNILTGGGTKGIISGGVSYAHTREALAGRECKLLKISTVPFPDKLALKFIEGLEEILVIEELDPVIEDELIRLRGLYGFNVKIFGKHTEHIHNAGENTIDSVTRAVDSFLGAEIVNQNKSTVSLPPLPVRPPVLCAGCPHRASFLTVKEAAKGKKAVFTGDIGCYTLGNAKPLDMVDTCLCMGGGITVAQGLKRAEPDAVHFAFIGDSTFFHSGITGLINAVYNQTDIVVIILDNSTTAMTGNQPHPGMGITMMGNKPPKVSIKRIIEALDVAQFICVDPMDRNAALDAVKSVIDVSGVRVVLFESPCIVLAKSRRKAGVDKDKCTGCKLCVTKPGCPAISIKEDKAIIDNALCVGCTVCSDICAFNAISVKEEATK